MDRDEWIYSNEPRLQRRRSDGLVAKPLTDDEVRQMRNDGEFWRQLGVDVRAAKPEDLAPIGTTVRRVGAFPLPEHVEVAGAPRPTVLARARLFARDVWRTIRANWWWV